MWLAWFYFKSYQLDFSDPFWYPFLILWIGGCLYVLGSSIAHGFANKSPAWLHILSMVDYAGISLYIFGLSMALYFYERPVVHAVDLRIFEYKWVFVIMYVTFAMLAVSMSSLSRFQNHNNASLYRVIGFLPIHLTGVIPLVTCLLVSLCTCDDCVSNTILFHCLGFMSLLAAIFFFVTKIP